MPAPGLPLFAREFRVPRRGHLLEDCEDIAALAPERYDALAHLYERQFTTKGRS